MADRVEIPIDLSVEDIDTSKLNKSSITKSLKGVTSTLKGVFNKATGNKTSGIFDAFFGKTSVADLQKSIAVASAGMETMQKERERALKSAESYHKKSESLEKQNEQSKKDAVKKLEKLNEYEASLPEKLGTAQQAYASAKGSYTRSKDPAKKEHYRQLMERAEAEYNALKFNAGPTGQASRNDTRARLNNEIVNGKYAGELAEVNRQEEESVKRAKFFDDAMQKRQQTINNTTKALKAAKIGSVVSYIFGGGDGKSGGGGGRSKSGGGGSFGRGLKKATKNLMMFGLGFRSLYYLVKRLRKIVTENLAYIALKFEDINGPLSELLTSFNQFKGSMVAMVQPLISAVVPWLTTVINSLSKAAEEVSEFFAVLTGQDYVLKAKANQKDFATAFSKTAKVADYDQLKVIGQGQDIDFEKAAVNTEKVNKEHGELLKKLRSFKTTLRESFGLIGQLVKNMLPYIERIITAILPVAETVIKNIVPIASDFIMMILPVLTQWVEQLAPYFQSLVELIMPRLHELLLKLEPIFQTITDKVLPFIFDVLDALWPIIEAIVGLVFDLLDPILDLIDPLLNLVVDILQPILELLKPILSMVGTLISSVGKIAKSILSLIAPLIKLLDTILPPLLEFIGEFIGPILEGMKVAYEWLMDKFVVVYEWLSDKLTKAIEWIIEKVTGAKETIKGVVEAVRGFIKDIWGDVKEVLNKVIGGIESAVNFILNGVNKLIDGINSISITVPDWGIFGDLAGQTWGPNIPHISTVTIPKLAQGAVIPPNREFLASLGDQRHGTNIEAPLETIKQALIEAMRESGGTNGPIVLQIDGRTMAQVVWDENEKRYKQTGNPVYAY